MKARAGIVGPKYSVELIIDIAEEYTDKLQTVPFIYQNTEETIHILQTNQESADLWVFAGPALYKPSQKSGAKQPFFYLNLDGASLTKTLMEISNNNKKSVERVSIDMLLERDVYETYDDLYISREQVYVHEYTHDTPLNDLLSFHQKLYRQGKVDCCITCLRSIYETLQSEGIPAYWVTPTRSNIRETLKTAIQQWETLQFKQSQIAVILVNTEIMNKHSDRHVLSYDQHRLNLDLQSAVLSFSESISGSFMPLGIGSFVIFSTRGSLEDSKQHIQLLIDKLMLKTDLPSNIGIGYGDTALTAEENARLALNHAQNYETFCAFLVNNEGMIEGPLKEDKEISYSYRSENKILNEKLAKCGVTITTYNKIYSVQKRMENNSITAAGLADWLKMTPRNARRILNGLAEQGLVEIIGEEAPKSKGRPSKIYRITTSRKI
ncbi:putative transcriptional regulator [Evansella vedderi]|uniref:Transcriptional regulator n=1 Tax=Evansella vedderi TaxID=38282 RepID=A0ABT9ZNJ7_9BACI|nr:hypothetical protein [Evansella vedderi]MDQ0252809.1 putative transcriptional regulator [Evansella vedderi]